MGIIDFLMKLVILSLPIFAIPMLLKSSSNVMGKIGGMVQARGSKMTAGYSEKARANYKSGAEFNKRNLKNKALGTDRFGGNIQKAALGAQGWKRRREANKRMRDLAVSAYDKNKEGRVEELMGAELGKAASDDSSIRASATKAALSSMSVGGTKLESYAEQAAQKAFNERVGAIQAKFEVRGTDIGELGRTLSKAIRDGDKETATAAIKRLSVMGASGVEEVATRLQGGVSSEKDATGAPVSVAAPSVGDAGMRQVLSNAVNDGSVYGALVEKSGDVAKGGFDGSGQWQGNFDGLSTSQVAGLSPKALQRYAEEVKQARDGISSGSLSGADLAAAQKKVERAQAHTAAIYANETLSGKISDPDANKALHSMR